MDAVLMAGPVILPAPVELSVDDEIIWSSDTGRTMDGLMIGDVVAEKKNLKISWGILTESELVMIKQNLIAGFFPVTFHDDGMDITIESYRGTLSKSVIGKLGDGIFYYRSASVNLIER